MNDPNFKWQEILGDVRFSGYTFYPAPAPKTDYDTVLRFRTLCRENKCGCYGTTWSCPPESCSDDEVVSTLAGYNRAWIVSKRYDDIETTSLSAFAVVQKEFQNVCRDISLKAKDKGIENLALGDGGSTYCAKCTYPEMCRYPDKRVMSISGMGIDIGKYLNEQGIGFRFEKEAITLYGVILY